MFGVWGVLGEVLVALFAIVVVRLLAGLVRPVPWAPSGDRDLVAAMGPRPRVPSRTACAVVDLATGGEPVRRAFNGCDGQSVFEVGSVTKALTGLLLADAVDRGEVALDTPLGQSWPELAGRPIATVTLRELAQHRAGLPGTPLGWTAVPRRLLSAYLGLDPYRRLGIGQVLTLAGRARLRQRGSVRYSNLGGALAGQAVGHGADCDFRDLLARRIAEPLRMTSTTADPAAARRSGRGFAGAWAQPWRLDGYGPAGGVTSTLDDLVLLAQHLLEGTCPGGSALDERLFWQVHETPQGFRRIWHNGQTGGYSAYFAVYPEARKAVVVLAAHANARRQEALAAACVRASRQ